MLVDSRCYSKVTTIRVCWIQRIQNVKEGNKKSLHILWVWYTSFVNENNLFKVKPLPKLLNLCRRPFKKKSITSTSPCGVVHVYYTRHHTGKLMIVKVFFPKAYDSFRRAPHRVHHHASVADLEVFFTEKDVIGDCVFQTIIVTHASYFFSGGGCHQIIAFK